MKIGVLKKGDHVIGVTAEYIVVGRKNGETDIIPIIKDGATLRVDIENILTIGYGNNTVEHTVGDVTLITF